MPIRTLLAAALAAAVSLSSIVTLARAAEPAKEVRIDWATYNPVSVVLKEKRFLEQELAKDGIAVRWVQSAGSNKALEFLNAGSLDFGSTAGAAALLGKVNGNPIRAIYVYSRPEWTALVARDGTAIASPKDLKGKTVAVTRGTDPHIFLVRALQDNGLSEKDVRLVLLQHADGRLALLRGDVDAWAGLDPLMAAAEIEAKARLFHRRPEANTWGILNVREAFARENPGLVRRVLAAYEIARTRALAEPDELKAYLVAVTKLAPEVIARQLERTGLGHSKIGAEQHESILAAGLALQKAGVINDGVDVKAVVDGLIDRQFN